MAMGSSNILDSFAIAIGWEVEPADAVRSETDKIVDRFREQSDKASQFVAGAFRKAAAAAAIATTAIVASAGAALHRYVELGSEVGDTAVKLGLTTDALQRLRHGLTATGGDAGVLKDAIKTMSVGLQEAATKGSGPLWEGLKLVGLELDDLKGRNPEDQIGILADALKAIPDEADRSASAIKLFGEGAALEMAPLLARGSAGIRELGDEAERTGLVMSGEAIAGAQQLKRSWVQLEAVGGAVAGQVGGKLAPALQDLATKGLAWVEANDQFIQQDLPAAIEATVRALGELVVWAVDVAQEFRNFGREVGYVADDIEAFAGDVRDLASTVADTLAPAVDLALTPLRAMWDVVSGIQGAIVDAIAEVLRYVGVLDDLKAAYQSLPFASDVPDDDVREGDNARGAPAFLNPEVEARRQAQAQASGVAAAIGASAGTRMAAAAAETASRLRAGDGARRASAREAGRAALAPPKSGGGGGSKAPAAKGSLLERLGLADVFADKGGGLRDFLGLDGGGGHSTAGGGSSPLAGATFATNDYTLNTTTNLTINLPKGAFVGLSGEAQAKLVAQAAEDAISRQNRQALDYVSSPMRRG